jgi:hypothetical protein
MHEGFPLAGPKFGHAQTYDLGPLSSRSKATIQLQDRFVPLAPRNLGKRLMFAELTGKVGETGTEPFSLGRFGCGPEAW